MASTVFVLSLLLAASPMGQKKRDWLEGKVLNVVMKEELQVSTGDPRSGGGISSTAMVMYFTYTVDVNGNRYECKEQATKPRFTEGQTIKIALEKKNWFIIDEKGKEKKGDIVGRKEVKP